MRRMVEAGLEHHLRTESDCRILRDEPGSDGPQTPGHSSH